MCRFRAALKISSMKNFICEGDIIEVVAPANILSGDVVSIGKLIGIATTSANQGDVVAVRVKGVYSLPLATGTVINHGDVVYWDATNKVVTETATNNVQLGYAYTATSATDVQALIKLWAA